MSFVKLVILGGVGYLSYRLLRELPFSTALPHAAAGRSSQPAPPTPARLPMTGGGAGMTQSTEDLTGESVPHRVGRGVIH